MRKYKNPKDIRFPSTDEGVELCLDLVEQNKIYDQQLQAYNVVCSKEVEELTELVEALETIMTTFQQDTETCKEELNACLFSK